MRITQAVAAFALSLLFVHASYAAPDREGCQTGTPEGEEACLRPDLQQIEAALDRQVHQLRRQLSKSSRTQGTRAMMRLDASQQSWLQYRLNFCNLEGLVSAGTGEWLQVRILECRMRMTKDRLESVRDIEAALE